MLNSHWRNLYCDLFIFWTSFNSVVSFPILSAHFNNGNNCPTTVLIFMSGWDIGTDWLSLVASGEKVPQSAGNTRREWRMDEEWEEVQRRGNKNNEKRRMRSCDTGLQGSAGGRRRWQDVRGGIHGRRCRRLHVDAQSDLPSALCACNVSIQELDWTPLRDCGRATSRKRQRA